MISKVEVCIYNVLGQKMTTLVSKEQQAGYYSIECNASGLASGIYFYRLQANHYSEMKKMILMQ